MNVLLIPLAALLIPIVIVPTALGLKHARFLREVEHAERMRALELGRTPADDESWTPGNLAAAIGAGVPLGSLAIAWLAGQSTPALAGPIATAAGFIGLGGVISGTILATRLSASRDRPSIPCRPDEKPAYDPEDHDFAGSRV